MSIENNFYVENEKALPIIAKVQVLVCGAGPAGIGAAIRSARQGAKTMIVEMQDCLGGVATAGMMSHFTGWSSSKILTEIQQRCKSKYQLLSAECENNYKDMTINQEVMKIVLNEMAKEDGIDVLFYTMVCSSIVENGEIKGVIVENKSGRGVILADVVIDATGDGDVAARAGVPYYKGREGDGKMQPCTLMFKIGGVDYERAVFPGSFESEVVTEKGEFLGGAIIPGVEMSLRALGSGTAQLPQISIEGTPEVIGKNTRDCMLSGIIYGSAGTVDGMIDRFKKELGEDATVVVTGGIADAIIPHLKNIVVYDRDLILEGLVRIYEKNA